VNGDRSPGRFLVLPRDRNRGAAQEGPVEMTTKEHDTAVQRLEVALREQDRLSDRYGAAVGTSNELSAYVRLRAAGEDVTTRSRRLEYLGTTEHSKS
jgi:hypothetical protein